MSPVRPDARVLSVTRMRLSYADTDPAGLVYYATWFGWMERVSTEWMFAQGFRYDRMAAEHGVAQVTRSTQCEYLRPTAVYDEIDIELRVPRVGVSSYDFGFMMVRCGEGDLVARSTLSLVTVDVRGCPIPLPQTLRATLEG
jgi:acyl-CoA thioester hydrolase